jgi:hypothetical protein
LISGRVKRRGTFALALIVLIAQLGAQAHAYSHLASVPDGAAHHTRTVPCAECSTFAPLLTAVSNASYVFAPAVLGQGGICLPVSVGVLRTAACRAYRSRAPPLQS